MMNSRSDLVAATGVSVFNLKMWRHRGYLDGIGVLVGPGRGLWTFSAAEVEAIRLAGVLVGLGVTPTAAFRMVSDGVAVAVIRSANGDS